MVKTKIVRFSVPTLLFLPFIQSLIICPFPIPWILCDECVVFSCFMNSKTTSLRRFLLINFLVSGLLVGRNFCSWVCPYGALQELSSILNRRRVFNPLKKSVQVIKISILSLTFLVAFTLFYPSISNFRFFLSFLMDNLYIVAAAFTSFVIAAPWLVIFLRFILFTFFLILASFWRRTWCKICPLGTLLSLFNKVSLFKLEINRAKCVDCDLCSSVCQMDLKPTAGGLESIECIKCLDCIQECRSTAITINPRKTTNAVHKRESM